MAVARKIWIGLAAVAAVGVGVAAAASPPDDPNPPGTQDEAARRAAELANLAAGSGHPVVEEVPEGLDYPQEPQYGDPLGSDDDGHDVVVLP